MDTFALGMISHGLFPSMSDGAVAPMTAGDRVDPPPAGVVRRLGQVDPGTVCEGDPPNCVRIPSYGSFPACSPYLSIPDGTPAVPTTPVTPDVFLPGGPPPFPVLMPPTVMPFPPNAPNPALFGQGGGGGPAMSPSPPPPAVSRVISHAGRAVSPAGQIVVQSSDVSVPVWMVALSAALTGVGVGYWYRGRRKGRR